MPNAPTAQDIIDVVRREGGIPAAWAQMHPDPMKAAYLAADDGEVFLALLEAAGQVGLVEVSGLTKTFGDDEDNPHILFRLRDSAGRYHRIDTTMVNLPFFVRNVLPQLPPVQAWLDAQASRDEQLPPLQLWQACLRRGQPLPEARHADARRAWRASPEGMEMVDIVRRVCTAEQSQAVNRHLEEQGVLHFTSMDRMAAVSADCVRRVVGEAPLPSDRRDERRASTSWWGRLKQKLSGGGRDDELEMGRATNMATDWKTHLQGQGGLVGCPTCGEPARHSRLKRCFAVDEAAFGKLVPFGDCTAHGRFLVEYDTDAHPLDACDSCEAPAMLDPEPNVQPQGGEGLVVEVETLCIACWEPTGRRTVAPVRRLAAFDVWADRADVEAVQDLFMPLQVDQPITVRVGDPLAEGTRVQYGDLSGFCVEPLEDVGTDLEVMGLRFDLACNELVVSHAAVLRHQAEAFAQNLSEGDTLLGIVEAVAPYGLFMQLGPTFGLLHVTELPKAAQASPEDFYAPGQSLDVVVGKVEGDRITLKLAPN